MIKPKHIFQEIKSPDTVVKMSEPPMLLLIYKAIYMCLRILLDIRNNTTSKKTIQKEVKLKTANNPVIKPTDIIKD